MIAGEGTIKITVKDHGTGRAGMREQGKKEVKLVRRRGFA
jgi:hypothetical protein